MSENGTDEMTVVIRRHDAYLDPMSKEGNANQTNQSQQHGDDQAANGKAGTPGRLTITKICCRRRRHGSPPIFSRMVGGHWRLFRSGVMAAAADAPKRSCFGGKPTAASLFVVKRNG